MAVMLKSSEVQQNFGRVMDQALSEEEVMVERYGEPRVAIFMSCCAGLCFSTRSSPG